MGDWFKERAHEFWINGNFREDTVEQLMRKADARARDDCKRIAIKSEEMVGKQIAAAIERSKGDG